MTNMKNIGYLFLAGTIALSLSSCVSLDEEPSSSLVAENFYTKEADAISAVNAVYETLHYDAGQSLYNGLIQIRTCAQSQTLPTMCRTTAWRNFGLKVTKP